MPDEKPTLVDEDQQLEALTSVLPIFQKLPPDARERLLQTIATFFGLNGGSEARVSLGQGSIQAQATHPASFSEDRSISPKEFMFQKAPRTDVERVACLAYYLTHYRDNPQFKTLDLSKLNTEAAQPKFSNPAFSTNNAVKMGYLVPATKGNKQLSAVGEQFVQALPDREAAKEVMTRARPRRKPTRKNAAKKSGDYTEVISAQ